jgi:branched-chain amino acid transport system substrate-binding protein
MDVTLPYSDRPGQKAPHDAEEDKQTLRRNLGLMKLRYSGALAITAIIAVACGTGGASPTPAVTGAPSPGVTGSPSTAPMGTIKIGVDLPLSGGDAQNGQPTLKGAQLLVDEINEAGGIDGYMLELNVQDDVRDGRYNPDQGAANMRVLVNDPDVVAAVGPYNSAVARVQIPISNEAGMLQCSPANTAESLTKPEFGGLDLRPAFPDRIAYIRIATTDDVQGPAGASYAYNDLGLRNMLIVDDTTTFGEGVADNFQAEFERLGGTTAQRVGAQPTTTDFIPILTAAVDLEIDGVYYGGVTSSGGGLMRKQMPQAGLGELPLVGPDGIQDGSGSAPTSFIGIAQEAAANSFSTIAAIGDFPGKTEFEAAYAARFANDAEFKTAGPYSGPAYACTQVITESIRAALAAGVDPADSAAFREAVRAHALSGAEFTTVVGEISFDENGDNTSKFISFYRVDMAGDNGNGAWVFEKQQDFGVPAP